MRNAFFRGFLALIIITGSVHLRADFTDLAGLVPADTDLFLRTERIDRLLEQFAPFVNDYLERDRAGTLHAALDDFRQTTDIDILSSRSLKEEGIDTRRPMAVAWLDDFGGKPAFCLIVPVLNTDTYPLRFTEIVNLVREKRGERELFPVITGYRGRTMYRMGKNLVVLTLGTYLVVTDSHLLARECVNLYRDSSGSLARTPGYVEFRDTWQQKRTVHIYAGPHRTGRKLSLLAGDAGKRDIPSVRYRRTCLGTESNRLVMETLVRFEKGDMPKALLPEGRVEFIQPEKSGGAFRMTALPGLRDFCEEKDDTCPAYRTLKSRMEYHYGRDFWNIFTSPGGKGFALYMDEGEKRLLERSCGSRKKARDILASMKDTLATGKKPGKKKDSNQEKELEVSEKDGVITITSGEGESWYLRRVEDILLLGNDLQMVRQADDPHPLEQTRLLELETGDDLETWLRQTGFTRPMAGYLLPSLYKIEMTGEKSDRGLLIRYEYHLRKAR